MKSFILLIGLLFSLVSFAQDIPANNRDADSQRLTTKSQTNGSFNAVGSQGRPCTGDCPMCCRNANRVRLGDVRNAAGSRSRFIPGAQPATTAPTPGAGQEAGAVNTSE